MAEFYFSARIDNQTTLCVAPLTEKHIALSGQHVADPSGYFLFQTKRASELSEVVILAHVVGEDAAFELKRLLDLR